MRVQCGSSIKQPAGSESQPISLMPVVSRAFFASVLITGNLKLAEGAVMNAIQLLNADEADARSGAMLLDNSIDAALLAEAEQGVLTSCEEREVTSLLLPAILRNVLRLDRYPRLCYVLRVLLGLTRERCATKLRLDVHQADTFAVTAMCELVSSLGYEQANCNPSANQYGV